MALARGWVALWGQALLLAGRYCQLQASFSHELGLSWRAPRGYTSSSVPPSPNPPMAMLLLDWIRSITPAPSAARLLLPTGSPPTEIVEYILGSDHGRDRLLCFVEKTCPSQDSSVSGLAACLFDAAQNRRNCLKPYWIQAGERSTFGDMNVSCFLRDARVSWHRIDKHNEKDQKNPLYFLERTGRYMTQNSAMMATALAQAKNVIEGPEGIGNGYLILPLQIPRSPGRVAVLEAVWRTVELQETSEDGTYGDDYKIPREVEDIINWSTLQNLRDHMLLENIGKVFPSRVAPSPHRVASPKLIGDSPKMKKLQEELLVWAPTSHNILLLGPSGAGKEVCAAQIHEGSPRKGKPFVAVNCAGLSKNLIESLLFGHARGAFSGATNDHKGYFEQANGGTLFLDEIGDFDIEAQAKVLRAIQDQTITPVGARTSIRCDIRFLAATNKNLEKEVHEGRFRDDLYQRIKTKIILLPPLNQREGDVILLLEHFLKEEQNAPGTCDEIRSSFRVPYERQKSIRDYPWPGNVRELKNYATRVSVCGWSNTPIKEEIAEYTWEGEQPETSKEQPKKKRRVALDEIKTESRFARSTKLVIRILVASYKKDPNKYVARKDLEKHIEDDEIQIGDDKIQGVRRILEKRGWTIPRATKGQGYRLAPLDGWEDP